MSRIALFGGTFDPIHWGHLLLAESARETYRLDRIVFIPSGFPPHKRKPIASARDRLKMVRLAIQSNPAFAVSDWEIHQKRIVYTFETLAYFRKRWPRNRLSFILGTDMLATLGQWRTGRALLKQCEFLAVERPGYPWAHMPAAVRRASRRVPSPPIPLSSHEIRARVRRGRSIRYQVLPPVERYIRDRGLYR